MKIIDSQGAPNPRRVRIFLAEKGVEIPFETADILKGELQTPEFRTLNPLQQAPVLILDEGTVITESVAICRYFEELHPEPPLFGVGAKGRALVEMWNRRVELGLFNQIMAAFRHLHPALAGREVPQIAAWGEANKVKMLESLTALDKRLGESEFVAGDLYSIADITALVAVDFMRVTKVKAPEDHVHLARWRALMNARPSSTA